MVVIGEAIEAYTKGARDTLKQYGQEIVVGMSVHREPIQGILDKVIGVLSGGTWEDLKKKNAYDKFFHLYALVRLNTGRVIRVEKNANITLAPDGQAGDEGEVRDVNFTGVSPFTFEEMLDRTRQMMGDYRYFGYSPFADEKNVSNNCQDFILAILKANKLGDEELKKFVKQDIVELSKELPGITKRIGDAITGLGSYVEHGIGKVRDFLGFKKGGRVPGRVVKGFHVGNNRRVIRRGRF
jgi:hypothetical protein